MNALVINGTKLPLKNEIIDFFINKPIIDFVTILERRDINIENYNLKLDLESNLKKKFVFVDFSDKNKILSILKEVITNFKGPSFVLYVENVNGFSQKNFSNLDILSFKNILHNEVVTKTIIFQALVFCLKKLNTITRIVVLVPPIFQSKLYKGNIEQNILISNLNMLTTSFADEFIDNNIYCNAVINDEYAFKTLDWLFLESQEKIHGKLFSNKQIINW